MAVPPHLLFGLVECHLPPCVFLFHLSENIVSLHLWIIIALNQSFFKGLGGFVLKV